jgi:hypothetical protein
MTTYTRFKLRNDTAANWTATNPVLLQGEIGVETDNRRYKIGDGTTAWSSLSYYIEGVLARGQASKTTSGTIAITSAGTYQSTGLTATFDSATDYQVVLGTSVWPKERQRRHQALHGAGQHGCLCRQQSHDRHQTGKERRWH